VRWVVLGPVALLLAGLALVVVSVAKGGADVALLVVFPVVYGSSLGFLLGAILLFAGFLSLPFALGMEEDEARSTPSLADPPPPTGASGGVGGFVLIGPVPIVFGSWKGVSRRVRWALAVAGSVLLTVVVVAFLWFLR